MINKLLANFHDLRSRQRMIIALTKGAAMMQARNIDLTRPTTWEFSGFSQNGEDGILDVLRKQLADSNRYFLEIGSADGIENNSAWLVVAEKYNGLMIEGDAKLAARANRLATAFSIGAECRNMFVTAENVQGLLALSFHNDADVFSLDIDGNDYYIAKALLDAGFRPKIVVVEYNSVYGPERRMTVKYRPSFSFRSAHLTQLYYGVSLAGWKDFFESHGYHFVTVERNGVNAFFVDPTCFSRQFLDSIHPLEFAENRYQQRKFRTSSAQQFDLIADQEYVVL